MSATVFTSFAELAAYAGVKATGSKKLKKAMPESSFLAVKEAAGKPAAIVWVAMNDREASKKSGPSGSPFFTVGEIVEETGFDEEAVVNGVIRLAKAGLLSKITPDGRIAA